jgi:NTP pyrophosphatase (non-canonical NTP hydrolase)
MGHADWEAEKFIIMNKNLEAHLEDFVEDATRTEPDAHGYRKSLARLADPRTIRLLHAAMGLCTEAGEFMDQIKRHVFYGKDLDLVNLTEELGDSSWYERIALSALEQTYLSMLERNVAKLKARFPDKFTEQKAVDRDLDAERKILEDA